MPNYDYVCRNCQQRFDVFMTFSEYGKKTVTCAHCNSKNVRRRMTKVRIAKSEDSRMDSIASGLEGLNDDPKEMGRMMRKMGKEMGEAMPPEFDEVVGRLEKGQSPEEVEKAVPNLADIASSDDD